MWILENLLSDEQSRMSSNFVKMKSGLEDNKIPYKLIKTIPFLHEFEENINFKSTFVYGSTITLKAAKKQNLKLYVAPTEQEVKNNIQTDYLNYDMEILSHDEVEKYMEENGADWFFIKPNADLKSFDGTIVDIKKYPFFIERVMKTNNYEPDTLICVSSLKHVHKEWRVFVVDGKISTFSQYLIDRKVVSEHSITDDAYNFVNSIIEKYSPSDMNVIDVGLTDNGEYKVIEYNTINCSGLYSANVGKLILDIERFENGNG